ncbi:hypothetical protein ACQ5SO_20685 [Rhodovulum sp. DZ06]|uniref:hypothetical protein n=1 Tax=Rhodovulum sp. DZ06 TaxID=3425126 RepID=UPI003D350226
MTEDLSPLEAPAQVAADLAALAAIAPPDRREGTAAAVLSEDGAPAARLWPALAQALKKGLAQRAGEAPPKGAPGFGDVPGDAALWALHGRRIQRAPGPVRAAICAGLRIRALLGLGDLGADAIPPEACMTVPPEALRADLWKLARSMAPGQRAQVIAYAAHGATGFRQEPEAAGLELILSAGRTDVSDGWDSIDYTAAIPARTGWAHCVALLLLRALDAAAEGPDRASVAFIAAERLWKTRRAALDDLSDARRDTLLAGFRGVFEAHLAPVEAAEQAAPDEALPWSGLGG